ncbi:MAG TPA: CsgG/HfaB family protein [Calditrichia bacterium]|nr:hypothetical protein [Calditrichota bacterium]HQU72491.1 CsgG/HfaB family protein [Calditrichia bacterium]HQV32715.1 CsgG/HfaB family protein [Calditrichia bacterium]
MELQKITGLRLRVLALVGLFIVSLGAGSLLMANHVTNLQTAIDAYKSADFDTAIRLLNEIINDETADIEHQKEALRYLGRCYVAKRMLDKAKNAISTLIELEPPITEFDPDREAPPLMTVYYEARKELEGGSYEVERPDPGMKTMAILDFKNSSFFEKEKYDPMEKGFSDILINKMNGLTNLKVVERERIQWILDEMKIQDKYSKEGAVRAGKLLGAHTALMGSFIVQDKNKIYLGVRLVKVETSEILLTESVEGKMDDFLKLTEELSQKVAKAIDAEPKFAMREDKRDSDRLEAMMAYSKGLGFLEGAEYEKAYEKFEEALAFDPKYDRARQKAESIKYLVASL